jgi:hypothetical protein
MINDFLVIILDLKYAFEWTHWTGVCIAAILPTGTDVEKKPE